MLKVTFKGGVSLTLQGGRLLAVIITAWRSHKAETGRIQWLAHAFGFIAADDN
jgi:hypothetical protein